MSYLVKKNPKKNKIEISLNELELNFMIEVIESPRFGATAYFPDLCALTANEQIPMRKTLAFHVNS